MKSAAFWKKLCTFKRPSWYCYLVLCGHIRLFILNLLVIEIIYSWPIIYEGEWSQDFFETTGMTSFLLIFDYIPAFYFIVGTYKNNMPKLQKYFDISGATVYILGFPALFDLHRITGVLMNQENAGGMPADKWSQQLQNSVLMLILVGLDIYIYVQGKKHWLCKTKTSAVNTEATKPEYIVKIGKSFEQPCVITEKINLGDSKKIDANVDAADYRKKMIMPDEKDAHIDVDVERGG